MPRRLQLLATALRGNSTALQTVLLSIMTLIIMGIICSLTSRQLNNIVIYFAPINSESSHPYVPERKLKLVSVLASIGIIITLVVLTPEKQSAYWVFTYVTDGSGWGSKGFSFLLGYFHLTQYTRPYLKHSIDSCPWPGR